MKKWFAILLILTIALCFAACGNTAYEKYVGEWVTTEWRENGNSVNNRKIPEFKLELKEGGKGEIMLGIERKNLKWSGDDSVLNVKIDGDTYKADVKDGKAVFEDFLQTGLEITFAPKSNVESNFEQYMSDADKKMTGTWISYRVEDVLGDDLSETVRSDGLVVAFKKDYTADVKIEDVLRKNEKWSMLDESWGSLDETDCDLSWEIINDELKATYYNGKEFYIFFCKKI